MMATDLRGPVLSSVRGSDPRDRLRHSPWMDFRRGITQPVLTVAMRYAHEAAFISISKYRDPATPNLSGAKRDAIALGALFTDAIPYLAARLPTDEPPALSAVRAALAQLLTNAASNTETIGLKAPKAQRYHRERKSADPATLIVLPLAYYASPLAHC